MIDSETVQQFKTLVIENGEVISVKDLITALKHEFNDDDILEIFFDESIRISCVKESR